jgi:hypothetical protein
MESVPFKYIATFTLFQLIYFLFCYGVTWIPIAGILFPLPFFLLIMIRQHFLPKFFHPHHLQELDSAEWEEVTGRSLSVSSRVCNIHCLHFLWTYTIKCHHLPSLNFVPFNLNKCAVLFIRNPKLQAKKVEWSNPMLRY